MIDKKQAENVEYWNYLGKHDNKWCKMYTRN
jgi:hypothetical protein